MSALAVFVEESNRIEGIVREPFESEIVAHQLILRKPKVTIRALQNFVADVAHRPLRDEVGRDVRVGSHVPPPGGPEIRAYLATILGWINDGEVTPYEGHVRYEELHPFMDGNGRSGRAVWAWTMQRKGLDPFALPFLHRFYYQALDAARPSLAGAASGEGHQ